ASAALRLHGCREIAAGLVELATPNRAVLVQLEAVLLVRSGGDEEEVAGALARSARLEELGNEQLRDEGARAIPRAFHVPAEVTLGEDRQVGGHFPRVVVECGGVLPLRGEAEVRRCRNVEDLVLRARIGLGDLEAQTVEQREVRAQLGLSGRFRLELVVSGL